MAAALIIPAIESSGAFALEACFKVGEMIVSHPVSEGLHQIVMNNGGTSFLQNLELVRARRVQFFEAGLELPSLSNIHLPEWPKGLTMKNLINILETPQAKISLLAAQLARHGWVKRKKRKKKKKMQRAMDDLSEYQKKQDMRLARLASAAMIRQSKEKEQMKELKINTSLALNNAKHDLIVSQRKLSTAMGLLILDSNVGIRHNSQELKKISGQMTQAIGTINTMGKEVQDTKKEVVSLSGKLYGDKDDSVEKGDIPLIKESLEKLASELIVEGVDEDGNVIKEVSFEQQWHNKMNEWEKTREKKMAKIVEMEEKRLKGEKLQNQRNDALHHNVKTGRYYLMYIKRYNGVFFGRVTKIDHAGAHIIFDDDVFPVEYALFNRLYKKKDVGGGSGETKTGDSKRSTINGASYLQLPLHRRCEILGDARYYSERSDYKSKRKTNSLYTKEDYLIFRYKDSNFDGGDEHNDYLRCTPGKIILPINSYTEDSVESLVRKAHDCVTTRNNRRLIMHEDNHWKIYDNFWSIIKKPEYLVTAEECSKGRELKIWMHEERLDDIISDADGTWVDNLSNITKVLHEIFIKFASSTTDKIMKQRFVRIRRARASPPPATGGCVIV